MSAPAGNSSGRRWGHRTQQGCGASDPLCSPGKTTYTATPASSRICSSPVVCADQRSTASSPRTPDYSSNQPHPSTGLVLTQFGLGIHWTLLTAHPKSFVDRLVAKTSAHAKKPALCFACTRAFIDGVAGANRRRALPHFQLHQPVYSCLARPDLPGAPGVWSRRPGGG